MGIRDLLCPTSPKNIKIKETEQKAWLLRVKKYTYAQIAEELGLYDKSVAHKIVKRYAQKVDLETQEEARAIIDEQNDEIAKVLFDKALTGDTKAAEVFLKYQSEKSKLWGLYAPAKTESKMMKYEVKVANVDLSKVTDEIEENNYKQIENKNE